MDNVKGCLHIYCGDGKGKTTAAVGLAVRAAGYGMKVLFCQCMKDGTSSEVEMLQKLGIDYCCCTEKFGFYWNMTEEQKEKAKEENYGMLVIDEFMSAYQYGMIAPREAIRFLMERPEGLEVVLTGRDPGEELIELADYVTEMKKRKHPFDKGVKARKGIEM